MRKVNESFPRCDCVYVMLGGRKMDNRIIEMSYSPDFLRVLCQVSRSTGNF